MTRSADGTRGAKLMINHSSSFLVPKKSQNAAQRTSTAVHAQQAHRTLDLEHGSIMKRIEREHVRATSLKTEKDRLEERVARLEEKPRNEMTDGDFDELKRCMRELDAIDAEMEEAEDIGDSIGYFVRTGGVLFKYYDILEKGGAAVCPPVASSAAPAAAAAAAATTSGGKIPNGPSGPPEPRSILSYFTQKPTTADATTPPSSAAAAAAADGPTGSNSSNEGLDRATLYEKYMQCISGIHVSKPLEKSERSSGGGGSHGPCPHCNYSERTVQLQDGYVFCNKCHTVEYILVDHEKPSYKDPPKDVSYFAYKRSNHFSEWLNQVQGKETTEIPEEVYDAILLEIKKEKVKNMATLTKEKIKTILKRLKIYKFYEHATLIISRINGIPPPHFPPELEDKLRQMFVEIQLPFVKHSPPKRKNFLSYSYCLRKMMQLLEQDQYIEAFSLLKARDKLQVQDNIWKKICEDLGWQYIASL